MTTNESLTPGDGLTSTDPITPTTPATPIATNHSLSANPTSIHPFGNPLSSVLTVKLDEKNYILWKKMVLAVLKGQKLDGYVLGTKAQPPEFISKGKEAGSSELVPNPACEEWSTMDQALLGWMYGSMTPAIACEIINYTTSRQVWKALEDLYGTTNRARKQQLKATLQNTRKGTMKMSEYLTLMKQAADNLALAGAPVEIDDLTSYIVSGLDAEYLPITCQINEMTEMTWQKLHATLVTFENTLINLNVINSNNEVGNLTANLVFNRQSSLANQTNNKNPNPNRRQFSNNYNGYNGTRNHGGRGSNFRSNNSKPTCQVCGKYGHSAAICFHRFKKEYNGAPPNQENNNQNSAYIATPETVADPSWLADSGASNHITPDIGNLKIQAEYQGQGNRDGGASRDT